MLAATHRSRLATAGGSSRSIRIVSGVSLSTASSGPSSSESIATVMCRSSLEHELRKVFFRIRNIHARKLVPGVKRR